MQQLSLLNNKTSSSAIFSPCRQYRYILWRSWEENWEDNFCMFNCLNPSTADETLDDPTIRRCIQYCKDWGYSGYVMGNIFAYRATDPKVMKAQAEPIGAENNRYLVEYAARAKVVIAAWGTHGSHLDRHNQVKQMIPNLHCLKVTQNGFPDHPLYLKRNLQPIPYGNN